MPYAHTALYTTVVCMHLANKTTKLLVAYFPQNFVFRFPFWLANIFFVWNCSHFIHKAFQITRYMCLNTRLWKTKNQAKVFQFLGYWIGWMVNIVFDFRYTMFCMRNAGWFLALVTLFYSCGFATPIYMDHFMRLCLNSAQMQRLSQLFHSIDGQMQKQQKVSNYRWYLNKASTVFGRYQMFNREKCRIFDNNNQINIIIPLDTEYWIPDACTTFTVRKLQFFLPYSVK